MLSLSLYFLYNIAIYPNGPLLTNGLLLMSLPETVETHQEYKSKYSWDTFYANKLCQKWIEERLNKHFITFQSFTIQIIDDQSHDTSFQYILYK